MELPMRYRQFILAAGVSFSPAAVLADEDLEITFNDHCRECHSFLKGDNRLGPPLRGRRTQSRYEPGYAYTQSLKGSGVTWDEPTLDKWIANPGAVIPEQWHRVRRMAASPMRRSASASSRT